jgi:very-short-patch-repair endonuclease
MEDYKDKLFHGANPKLFEFSQVLRRNQTEAEDIIWQCLRNRKILNFKFRRQHPVHHYIADFYCHEAKLIIEIDGGIHNNPENQEYDNNRSNELKDIGITVIRFKNEEVNGNLDEVLNRIKGYLTPSSPLLEERGRGAENSNNQT